ncbi:MAG: hypothetical protein RR271_06710 [Oscillospiraceae bacterium]
MLGKLLKHEVRAISHIVFPLYGMALIVVALSKLTMVFGWFDSPNLWLRLPSGIITFAMVIALLGVMFISMISLIMRFYKNLMGDEGYLMFTLPVTGTQLLASKLISAVGTMLCSTAFIAACVLFLLGEIPDFSAIETVVNPFVILLVLFIAFTVGITVNFLLFYMSMAIGPQIMQNRLVGSIIAYIAITTILQIAGVVLMGIAALTTINLSSPGFFLTMNAFDIMACICGGIMTIMAVMGTIFFFITRHFITKKLNLA